MKRRTHDEIPITVERTGRRKTASIQVNNGRVRVLVPRFLPEKEIDELIERRMGWIRETARVQAGLRPALERTYTQGERFEYLGRRYRLEIVEAGNETVKLVRGCLTVGVEAGLGDQARRVAIRERLAGWYRSHALEQLRDRVAWYAPVLGVSRPAVVVRECESRWGSCSSTGKIMFNWKVIIAPPRIVDYVVVHELCHLLEHNHSPAYWRLVERVFPDYRDLRRRLREIGHRLDV